MPGAGDSVYVPYTGNDYDPPTYNPATNIPLGNLIVADDRILTLEQNLKVNDRLDLLGGFIDAESFPLLLGAAAQTFSTLFYVSLETLLCNNQREFICLVKLT